MSPDTNDTTFIGARVDDHLLARLDKIATEQNLSRSWLIRRALKNFVLKPDILTPEPSAETYPVSAE